jgi:cytochrome c oxidase cbb3-type subunit 3
MASSDTGSNPPDSAARRRPGWRFWGGLLLAVIVIAGAATYWSARAGIEARLMRAEPDSVVDNPELTRFAVAYAQPVFDSKCASCHGDHLQGNSKTGVPDMTRGAWLYGEGRVAQLEHTILHGIRSGDPRGWNLADMPAFGTPEPYKRYKITPLEPGEIRDVIEYMLVTAGKPGDGEAAKRGEKIFQDTGQCFDCHSADAQGDSAIGAPNLIDDIWLYGSGAREDIYESVARGRAGICPPWGQELSPVTVRALAVLLYVGSHRNAPKTADRTADPVPRTGG